MYLCDKVQEMIYLASPYTKLSPSERDEVVSDCKVIVSQFKNSLIYSPIIYSHQIADSYDYDAWIKHGLTILEVCDRMLIYSYTGWMVSKGIKLEVEKMLKLERPVLVIDRNGKNNEVQRRVYMRSVIEDVQK